MNLYLITGHTKGLGRALADRLATELTPETHARCTRIAALGQMVRGFGPVKEAAIARYDSELAAALSAS